MGVQGQSQRVTRRQVLGDLARLGGLAVAGAAGAVPAVSSAAPAVRPSSRSIDAASETTIRFPIWIGQSDVQAWKAVVQEFGKVNPAIKVNFEPFQFQQYWQKLNTQLAAGDAPAVCGMHVGLVYGYARKKQLVELGALASRDRFDLGQFFPNLLEEGRWPKSGGAAGLYMLPWRFTGSAFYVNKTLLAKHGIPVPTEGWTWDDWLRIAQEVRDEKGGIWGSSLPGGQLHQPYFMQAGAYGPLTPDLDKSNFLDPGIHEAVQFLADLALKHKVAPRPQDVPQGAGGVALDLFLSGKVALHPSAAWNIPAYRDVKFDWDVVPQPQHKAKGAYAGPDGIAIPVGSKQQEAAWTWIKFVTLTPAAQQILGSTGIPVSKAYALSDGYLNVEASRQPASYKMLVNELITIGRGFGFNESWFEWTREMNQIFQQIYNGKISVDEGLKQTNQKVTEILNRSQ